MARNQVIARIRPLPISEERMKQIEQNLLKAEIQARYDAVVAENEELKDRLKLHQSTIRGLYRELEALRNGEE